MMETTSREKQRSLSVASDIIEVDKSHSDWATKPKKVANYFRRKAIPKYKISKYIGTLPHKNKR